MHHTASLRLLFLSVAAACAVTACGGSPSDPPPAATPPAAGVTLTGVAATGAALAGATVDAKCNGSSGTTTTAADGAYTLTLSTGSLPCALRVTPAGGGAVLHSLAHGGGTAHITPVSQLLVASLAGDGPATYYGAFDATAAGALTAASVQEAKARVVATLKSGGADFSTLGDVLTAPLAVGNAFDQGLDALAQRMAAQGLTLSALTDAVQRASPNNLTPKTGTVSLPPEALLQPASPTCNALRSGTYRVVMLKASNAGEYATATVNFDAVAGTYATTNVGGSFNGQFTSTGACSYSLSNGGQMVVSQAGLVTMRTLEDGTTGAMRMVIAFPEQTHTLAELAGDWQTLGFERSDTGIYAGNSAAFTLGASGALSFTRYCPDVKTCPAIATPPNINLRLNGRGGFDMVNTTDNWVSRPFVYRAGNGDLMMVDISGNGSIGLWTQQRISTLPAVGAHLLSWGVRVNSQEVSTSAVSVSDFDVTALDAATQSYTRVSRTDGHIETLSINNPRDGYGFRPEGTAVSNTGASVVILEFTSLPLRGMGLAVLSLPTLVNGGSVPNGAYFLAVTQP